MKHFTVLHKIFSLLLLGFITATTLQAQTTINVGVNNTAEVISLPLSGHTNATDYIITGTTAVKKITIRTGYQGTITLKDLNITSSISSSIYGASGISCITVEGEDNRSNLNPLTKVNIILEGVNNLTYTQQSFCAIQVNQGAQIHISATDPNDNSSGTLTAACTAAASGGSGGGAAIGAPNFMNSRGQGTAKIYNKDGGFISQSANTAGGNIIISSGTVTASGGHAAGIGGGWYTYYNGIIIVYGGVIDVSVRRHAAGIGSGCPTGNGVIDNYAENSAIISLPPTKITGYGRDLETSPPDPSKALAGARNTTYLNDPNKTKVTIRTRDREPNATMYLDLTQTAGLVDVFQKLGIDYDLAKVRIGRTDASSGEYVFNAELKEPTTFFTDASSSQPASLGRPYLPHETTIVAPTTGVIPPREIILELLDMEISFTDYPSTPLEVGYTSQQAWNNAHRIKMEYNDDKPISNLTFKLQDGAASSFVGMKFLAADGITEVSAPSTLNKGDVYYIVLPIVQGKLIGIYSDVLLINGKWKGIDLPGYIRRIGLQRVVKNDTGINNHIKVTASPERFVDVFPATQTVDLTLNIDHTGTSAIYDPLDVKAKYLIATEADYDVALAANPNINSWANMNIPANNAVNQITTVPFLSLPRGTYYIHWYVESGVVYAHSQTVTVPPLQYGGFGPYIFADPVNTGTLSGNPFVCAGQTPSEIKGEVSTGGSGNFTYQWQISTNGVNWTNVGGNTPNYTPVPLAASPTYFRRQTIDNIYGGTTISNTFGIRIVDDGQTLYWKKDATNNNWNDPANWVDASGVALNIVPVSCSNVYIPGGLTNYPSLDPAKTLTDVFGIPICNNITFAYGAELAYQHKLTYQKAFIQYNWGYYDNFSGVSYGDQPSKNAGSPAAAQKRDTWYALAAPLKSMATGDFAFAGYPLTWQAGFALSNPVTGLAGGEIEVGDFDKKFPTNDVPLSETNNAIAVKVAVYKNSIGSVNHRNLESLKGIVEIPYFENSAKSAYYPGHSYDKFAKESKFFYFNPQTLQLLHSPVGKMRRGDEAYRFVYEENGVAPNITVAGIPSIVPGYKQKVKRQNSTSLKVMIGNPFMAPINAKQFFDINSGKLLESAGYQLFNSADQTWKHYAFSVGNIPSLQAFIVTLKNNEADLLFPLEGTYALTGFASAGTPAGQGYSLYLKSDGSSQGGDYSILTTPATNGVAANVKKMIYSQGHDTPETFFIAPDSKDYNLIQAYEKGMREIGIGVRSSDTKNAQQLTFENVDKFYTATNLRPILVDRHLNLKQDLTEINAYSFTQRKVDSKDTYIDADRFVLRLLSPDDLLLEQNGTDISIAYNDKKIEVRAVQNIKQIQIYDMLGHQIYSWDNINAHSYTKLLPLGQGVYIVKVYTENGETKVDKIMAL